MGGYGAWAKSLVDRPGILSFSANAGKNFDKWKKNGRDKVAELLGPLPARQPESIRVERSYRWQDLEIEELRWQVGYGPDTEAVFVKPAGATGPLPGVLALHDHASEKYFGWRKIARTAENVHPLLAEHRRSYYGGAAWVNELARLGYGVLAHDVFPFASRRILAAELPGFVVQRLVSPPDETAEPQPDDLRSAKTVLDRDVGPEATEDDIRRYDAFAGVHEHVLAKSLFCAGLTFPALFLGEDRVALSILAARPEIDSRRLGCCGLSGGGLRGVYLAGLDDRVRCAVVVGFMSTWRDFLLHKSFTHTWMLYLPHLSRYLDFPELLGLRAPLSTLVLATRQDPLFTVQEVKAAEAQLTGIYGGAGSPERFHMSLFPGPHCFDRAMQTEAFTWLGRWLSS